MWRYHVSNVDRNENMCGGAEVISSAAMCLEKYIRLTEPIQQCLARLGESGPEKQVLRARRTRGPTMAKKYKIQKSNRYVQNVGKVKYTRKHSTRNSKKLHVGPTSERFISPWNFGAQECPIRCPLSTNSALFTRFG